MMKNYINWGQNRINDYLRLAPVVRGSLITGITLGIYGLILGDKIKG